MGGLFNIEVARFLYWKIKHMLISNEIRKNRKILWIA